MRRWLRSILTVVAAVLASLGVLFGSGNPGAAASITPAKAASYNYDSPHQPSATASTTTERSPPATNTEATIHDADGLWSLGPSARQSADATRATYDYDDLVQLVRIATRSRATKDQVGGPEPGSLVVQRSDVAAKTETSLGSKLAESCLNSFTGTTPVLMADGSKNPIKDVKPGDWVMSKDPETGEQHREKVIRLIHHSGLHTMVAVHLSDGSTVAATDHHPFWVESRHAWVDAIDLRVGDVVENTAGQSIVVSGVGIRADDLTAYNLTVENVHTYFAGDDAVLVHNAGCDPSDLRGLSTSYVKRLLKQYDTEPHAFKEEFVGRGSVSKFDIKMGHVGELHLVK